MAKIIAMYGQPADPAAFDRYYFSKHVPLAKTVPGLRHYEVTTGIVMTPAGASPWHLVVTLTFDSMAAVQTALASPEGLATAADLANFATGGVDLLLADTRSL